MQLAVGVLALGPQLPARRDVPPGSHALAVEVLTAHHAAVLVGVLPQAGAPALFVGSVRWWVLGAHPSILPEAGACRSKVAGAIAGVPAQARSR